MFCDRLKIALREKGFTQAQLALYAKIDTGSIANYIKGRNVPRGDKIMRIARVLSVSPEWLMGDDTAETWWQPTSQMGLSEGERALIDLFRKVPEQDQELVVEMIRVAVSKKE